MFRWILALPVLACLLGAAPPVTKTKEAPTVTKTKEAPKPAQPGYLGAQLAVQGGMVIVQGVIVGAPAEKGGLRPGDVLLRINGLRPADLLTAVRLVRGLRPGAKAKIAVRRGGREMELEVTVGGA